MGKQREKAYVTSDARNFIIGILAFFSLFAFQFLLHKKTNILHSLCISFSFNNNDNSSLLSFITHFSRFGRNFSRIETDFDEIIRSPVYLGFCFAFDEAHHQNMMLDDRKNAIWFVIQSPAFKCHVKCQRTIFLYDFFRMKCKKYKAV